MDLEFQSFRSGSSGNCLMLWSASTTLLFDCGVKTQRDCRLLLEPHLAAGRRPAVLVSHAHSDHLHRASLTVLRQHQVPVHVHAKVLSQLEAAQTEALGAGPARFSAFPGDAFAVDDFHIQPVEVPHAPGFPNFGFVVRHGTGSRQRKLVLCTDFHDLTPMLEHLVDADFIFVEANHDLQLLRLHPNYSSRYHLSNPKSASLLYHAVRRSKKPPQAVMLGHLSQERNRDQLALDAIEEVFQRNRMKVEFELKIAPRYEPSALLRI